MRLDISDVELECVMVAGLQDIMDVMKIEELPEDDKGFDIFLYKENESFGL